MRRPVEEAPPRAPGRALIFDGSCGFCTWTARWILRRLRVPARVVPWQWIDLSRFGLDPVAADRSVWWAEPNGALLHSHLAVARALGACREPWPRLGRAIEGAPLRWLARIVYGMVVAVRHRLPGTRPAIADEERWRREMDRGLSVSDELEV